MIFCVFPSVPHLVDNYAKIVDERGRNFMCDRTLPSRLVYFYRLFNFQIRSGTSKKDMIIGAHQLIQINQNKLVLKPTKSEKKFRIKLYIPAKMFEFAQIS